MLKTLLILFVTFTFLNANFDSLSLINHYRTSSGLLSLSYSQTLSNSSQKHANYIEFTQEGGHEQLLQNKYFSGKTLQDRLLNEKYPFKFGIEVLSTEISKDKKNSKISEHTYEKSVYGLFSAIYHRFGLFDFYVDEIGYGGNTSVKVFNLGSKFYGELCAIPGHKKERYYTGCINNNTIPETTFNKVKNYYLKNSDQLVIFPFENQDDFYPIYFNEIPDPVPDYDYTGNPLSIQVNPYYIKSFHLKSYQLKEQHTNKTIPLRLIDHTNDKHSVFKENEFAFFPLKRLDWNTNYVFEFSYQSNGKDLVKTIPFKTAELNGSDYISMNSTMKKINFKDSKLLYVYVPPTLKDEIISGISYLSKDGDAFVKKIVINRIDYHTFKIEFPEKNFKNFKIIFKNSTGVNSILDIN
jgi:hypothetical protein